MSRFSELAPRWGAVLGWTLCGLLLVGCKTGKSDGGYASFNDAAAGVSNSPPSGAAATPGGANESTEMRRLRVGDVLKIVLSDIPILVAPSEQTVKEDGTIILLENKTFTAAGKTRSELEKEIHDTYVPRFFVKMTVSIEWKEATRFYFVGGEVKHPDRQVYISRITVLKAIQSAGDFTDFAKKSKIQLTRADGHKLFINYNKALKDPRLDPEVYPGDTITVLRRGI